MKRAVIVFAKEPIAGQVKTRLAAGIGSQMACHIYTRLLSNTLTQVARAEADAWLYLPPGQILAEAFDLTGFSVGVQRGDGLGERMADAFESSFSQGCDRVVLVGSDCPGLRTHHLNQALGSLDSCQTVFGPSLDGGYYLVGQRPPARDLFSAVDWSTDRVWEQTRRLLEAHGWGHVLLETLEDVDDPAGWERNRHLLDQFQETNRVDP